MNKLNLFNIEQQYMALADAIIENGGELTPELETALKLNKEQLETKGRSYGYIVRDLENEVSVIDAEIKRLSAFKVSRNKTIDRLKQTLSDAMELYQIEKLETPTLKISFRKSETIEVENVSILEEKYTVSKTTLTADKVKIKEAIKAGEDVIGAYLQTNKNIQIK